jgi:hypothetical protein
MAFLPGGAAATEHRKTDTCNRTAAQRRFISETNIKRVSFNTNVP